MKLPGSPASKSSGASSQASRSPKARALRATFDNGKPQLGDARRTLGIVALSLALSIGNTIPQGVSPAVTKTEAFAVVGVDVDRAIVVDVISASASATMLVDAFGEQRDLNVCAARVGKKRFASDGLASPGERIWETAR